MLVAKKEYAYNIEPSRQVNEKKLIKTRKRKKVINKTMYLGILAMFFISSFFILNRYADITQARYEISEMQKQLKELENERTDLLANLEGLKSTTAISEKAQTNLGMVYPNEDQIVYIAVNDINENTQDDISLSQRIREIFSIFSSIL